jgi:hypothetical protein
VLTAVRGREPVAFAHLAIGRKDRGDKQEHGHIRFLCCRHGDRDVGDALWDKCGHAERLRMLEALGHAMGRYHTVSLSVAQAKASEVSLEQWVVDAVEPSRKNAANVRT